MMEFLTLNLKSRNNKYKLKLFQIKIQINPICLLTDTEFSWKVYKFK